MKIESIKIERVIEENADLSYLGTYADSPEEYHIDRKARGDWEYGEYQYFNLGRKDPEDLEYAYDRVESYNREEWYSISIQAIAEITVCRIPQKIVSDGLFGIESDSDENHLKAVSEGEFAELAMVLEEMGFSQEEIEPQKLWEILTKKS